MDGKRSRYRETCSGLGLGQRSLTQTQTQTQAQEGNTKMIIIFIDIPSSKSYTKFILKHFVCCVFHRQQTSLSRGFLPLSLDCVLWLMFFFSIFWFNLPRIQTHTHPCSHSNVQSNHHWKQMYNATHVFHEPCHHALMSADLGEEIGTHEWNEKQ